jgi:hypothetical protein
VVFYKYPGHSKINHSSILTKVKKKGKGNSDVLVTQRNADKKDVSLDWQIASLKAKYGSGTRIYIYHF